MEAVALHVHLGMVNLLTDELEKLWPKIVVWFEKLALNREPYHGRHFEVLLLVACHVLKSYTKKTCIKGCQRTNNFIHYRQISIIANIEIKRK